jgi:hypothetical protein
MNKINSLILICGGLWLSTKIILSNLVDPSTNVMVGVMINLFFVLIVAFFSIREAERKRTKAESNMLDDIKSTAKNTIKYVLLATFLIAAYYYVISPEEVDYRKSERTEMVMEALGTDEAFEELKQTQPELKNMKREELLQKELDNIEFIFSPFLQVTLSLIALLAAAIFYSILVTVLWRKLMSPS